MKKSANLYDIEYAKKLLEDTYALLGWQVFFTIVPLSAIQTDEKKDKENIKKAVGKLINQE